MYLYWLCVALHTFGCTHVCVGKCGIMPDIDITSLPQLFSMPASPKGSISPTSPQLGLQKCKATTPGFDVAVGIGTQVLMWTASTEPSPQPLLLLFWSTFSPLNEGTSLHTSLESLYLCVMGFCIHVYVNIYHFFFIFSFSYFFSETKSYITYTLCVARVTLDLLIFLPPPPRCCDYRYTPFSQCYVVLRIKPRACVQQTSALDYDTILHKLYTSPAHI